ncbi:MAG: NAD(P)/FAD-dependent oxidoreductase [Parvibaculaceae bacterium]
MVQSADVIVIGGGIAGASAASELASDRKVVLLEMEDRPGYHTTGRSAAMFVPTYGPPLIMAITRASADFFHNTPEGFADTPILSPRGELMLVQPGEEEEAEKARAMGLKDISMEKGKALIQLLRTDRLVALLLDEAAQSIDVDVLHQGFLRRFRQRGGTLTCDAEVTRLGRSNGTWRAETKQGAFEAPVVVNASGAWADIVAGRAGVRPCGLTPKRRSAALLSMPVDISRWPLTFGAGETFYFKPMGGKLMLSPADVTPVEPHDAWADDMLLAEAIERFQNVIDHEVTHIDHTWGGLRTFSPDGELVVGFDPEAQGFFWLAGQGGYGIQTSPAASRLAGALIRGAGVPADLVSEGITAAALSPARFAAA